MNQDSNRNSYWHGNIKIIAVLLSIWFLVSYGAGIIFVDFLNQFQIFGYKLGFWFGQQGSIICFVIIIFIYVKWMNKLDKLHQVEEE